MSAILETQPVVSLHDPGFGAVTVWQFGHCVTLWQHREGEPDIYDLAAQARAKLAELVASDQSGEH